MIHVLDCINTNYVPVFIPKLLLVLQTTAHCTLHERMHHCTCI